MESKLLVINELGWIRRVAGFHSNRDFSSLNWSDLTKMEHVHPLLNFNNDLFFLVHNHFGRPGGMAGGASRLGIVQCVAIQASDHGIHAFYVGHYLHLAYVSVAHLTFHSSIQMCPMAPFHARQNGIDPHPGNRRFRFVIGGQFLNRGSIFAEGGMAFHARGRIGKCHQPSAIGIRVAPRALKPQRQMCLVAVWKRLLRGGKRDGGVVHVLARNLRWRGLCSGG
jgi:hypothetical protein